MAEKLKGISAIIIARNEEKRIKNCLDSLKWASEIIVIDNNSTDMTNKIVKSYEVRIFHSIEKNFSQLRMFGLSKSRFQWILYIDADELVTPELRDEIIDIVNSASGNPECMSYYIYRKNYYLGHQWPYQDKMVRLFQKRVIKGWEGILHETAIVDGNIGYLKNNLIHYTHRTLEHMISKTNEWSQVEAELRYNSHHPSVVWWRFIRVMVTAFWESFFRQYGWRAGTVGWVESIYQSYSMFITYAKLWELQRNYGHNTIK